MIKELNDMNLEEKISIYETYVNDSGKRVSIIEDDCRGRKQYYHVVVFKPDSGEKAETVATRCNYLQAVRIAKEHYFK